MLFTPNSHLGVGWGVVQIQLPSLDGDSKSAKIQKSHFQGGFRSNFQVLMLSPNLLKSQSPISEGGEKGVQIQLPTFDAESKSAKIQKSHGEGGVSNPTSSF